MMYKRYPYAAVDPTTPPELGDTTVWRSCAPRWKKIWVSTLWGRVAGGRGHWNREIDFMTHHRDCLRLKISSLRFVTWLVVTKTCSRYSRMVSYHARMFSNTRWMVIGKIIFWWKNVKKKRFFHDFPISMTLPPTSYSSPTVSRPRFSFTEGRETFKQLYLRAPEELWDQPQHRNNS